MDDNLIKGLINGALFIGLLVVAFIIIYLSIHMIAVGGSNMMNHMLNSIMRM